MVAAPPKRFPLVSATSAAGSARGLFLFDPIAGHPGGYAADDPAPVTPCAPWHRLPARGI